MGFESINRAPARNIEKPPLYIEDREDAIDFIEERFESGERPAVTVPAEYIDALREKGLAPHATWIPGLDVIAGTFGRDPYLPGDDRVLVSVDGITVDQIQPRMTGPTSAFHGVVTLSGPIDPENITIH